MDAFVWTETKPRENRICQNKKKTCCDAWDISLRMGSTWAAFLSWRNNARMEWNTSNQWTRKREGKSHQNKNNFSMLQFCGLNDFCVTTAAFDTPWTKWINATKKVFTSNFHNADKSRAIVKVSEHFDSILQNGKGTGIFNSHCDSASTTF